MRTCLYAAILTPEEDGGFSVEFPDLPGCFTCGDDYADAVRMAADAAMTFTASMVRHGEALPPFRERTAPEGSIAAYVAFPVDEDYIVDGEVTSAAQAARDLGVSPGRVSQMLGRGQLDGYRRGRRTFVTLESIRRRMADPKQAGRPRKRRETVEA